MSKNPRKIIFILAIVIFAIFAPLLILWIQGIKFDFDQKKFVRTGGIFINVSNPNIEILLDGKLKKNTGLISKSAFIKKLLPREYKIEVRKSGHFTWQKNLPIREGEVTEVKNIVLIKENPQFKILAEEVENFWLSKNQEELLVRKNTGNKWKFLILKLSTNEWQEILSVDELKEKVEMRLLEWNSEHKQILFQEETQKAKNLLLIDYNLFPQIQTISFSLLKNAEKIILNPAQRDEILFLRGNSLFKKNLKIENGETLFLSDIIWFEIQDKNLFWLSPSGFLLKADLSLLKKEILNKIPFLLAQEKEFKAEICRMGFFFNIDKQLYHLNENGEAEKISETTEDFESSPDLEKLSFWGEREIWILEGNEEEKIFLSRFSETPKSLFWLTNFHLIFNIGEEIKIIEIDNRDYLNVVTLKTFKNPKIIFNGANKKLYILAEGKLSASEKLIP